MTEALPFLDFANASEAVLAYLQAETGFALWMVTRTDGDDWIVLQSRDSQYGIESGAVFRWSDSFCSRMVKGMGPRVAPDASSVPVYAEAEIAAQVVIGAYIGVPIYSGDGSLFGTLCAIDPQAKNTSIYHFLPLVELLARLLATLLGAEQKANRMARLYEKVEAEANTDILTGILNRRGWENQLSIEEARAKRYGTPCSVFVVDLNELKQINDTEGHGKGDDLIRRAASSLEQVVREGDIIARIGGDEFAILAIECNRAVAPVVADKIRAGLESAGISASLGYATRDPYRGIEDAVKEADRKMYEEKFAYRGRASKSQA